MLPPIALLVAITFTEVSETQNNLATLLASWKSEVPSNWIPWSVVSRDFNNDGLKDLLVSQHNTLGSRLFRQVENGQFINAQSETGYLSKDLCPGDNAPDVDIDFDSDGKLDVGCHSLGFRFVASLKYLGPTPPYFERRLDWDGSRTQWYDIKSPGVWAFLIQNRNGPFGERREKLWNGAGLTNATINLSAPLGVPQSVVLALNTAKTLCPDFLARVKFEDFNNDNVTDIIILGSVDGYNPNLSCYTSFYLQCPAVGECPNLPTGLPATGTPIYHYDLNNDGLKDFIIANGTNPGVYLRNLDGLYTHIDNPGFLEGINPYRSMPTKTELLDLNSDGLPEFINKSFNEVSAWQNNGDGTLTKILGPMNCWRSDPIFITDINNDSKLDIIGGGCPDGFNSTKLKFYLQN